MVNELQCAVSDGSWLRAHAVKIKLIFLEGLGKEFLPSLVITVMPPKTRSSPTRNMRLGCS